MKTHVDKTQKNKNQGVLNSLLKPQNVSESTFQPVDNRPEAFAQLKLQEEIKNSPRVQQLKAYQEMVNNSPQSVLTSQLQAIANNCIMQTAQQIKNLEDDSLQGKFEPFQKKENNTGLPNNLKSGIENLAGLSMDDVKVHYNSNKPAQLQAHAYAQGTDIHLASGQEKHLPHEAWHVVQQKQGRVKPTIQMKGNVNINDDVGLEKEADVMGAKAFQFVDNRPDSIAQRKLQKMANNSHKTKKELGTSVKHAHSTASIVVQAKSSDEQLSTHIENNSAEVIQTKLLFNGVWYGKGDSERLKAVAGDNTPAWTAMQLENNEIFFILNPDKKAWIKDAELNFMRFEGRNKVGGAKTGASSPDPFADVNFGPRHKTANRIGPKRPERRTVSRVRLFKYSSERDGHWMLQCFVEGGKSGPKPMKIDLTKDSYRIMYGAGEAPTKISSQFDFELKAPTPVKEVYNAMVKVAKAKGIWTGTDKYNCQDFALEMLKILPMQEQEADNLKREVDWRNNQK